MTGTFDYALHTLIDAEFDLSALTAKFRSDDTDAPVCDIAALARAQKQIKSGNEFRIP